MPGIVSRRCLDTFDPKQTGALNNDSNSYSAPLRSHHTRSLGVPTLDAHLRLWMEIVLVSDVFGRVKKKKYGDKRERKKERKKSNYSELKRVRWRDGSDQIPKPLPQNEDETKGDYQVLSLSLSLSLSLFPFLKTIEHGKPSG